MASAEAVGGASLAEACDGPSSAPLRDSTGKASKSFSFRLLWRDGRLLTHGMLMSAMFFCWFSISVESAYLAPWFISNGLSTIQAGVILAAQPIATVLIQPAIPKLGDALGQITLFILGLCTSTVSLSVYGSSPYMFPDGGAPLFIMFLLTATFAGFGEGMTETSIYTILQEEFGDMLGQVTGQCEACVGLGIVAGPPLGGLAFSAAGFWLPPIMCAGFLAVVAAVAFSWKCTRTQELEGEEDSDEEEEGARTADRIVFITALLGIFFSCFVIGSFEPLMTIHFIDDFGWSSSAVGAIFAAYGAVYVFFSLQGGRWCDLSVRSPRVLLCSGLFISAAGITTLAAPWALAGIIGVLLLGVADGFCIVAGLAILVQSARVGARASWISSVLSVAVGAGLGLGPLLSVPLSELVGGDRLLLALGVCQACVALVSCLTFSRRSLPMDAEASRAPTPSLSRAVSVTGTSLRTPVLARSRSITKR